MGLFSYPKHEYAVSCMKHAATSHTLTLTVTSCWPWNATANIGDNACQISRFHESILSPLSTLMYGIELFSFFKSCNYGLHTQELAWINERWYWVRESHSSRSWCFWKQPQYCRHYLSSSTALFLPSVSLIYVNPTRHVSLRLAS
jgi:hypothetical protein